MGLSTMAAGGATRTITSAEQIVPTPNEAPPQTDKMYFLGRAV